MTNVNSTHIEFKSQLGQFFRLRYGETMLPAGIPGFFTSFGMDQSKRERHYANFVFDMRDKFNIRGFSIIN